MRHPICEACVKVSMTGQEGWAAEVAPEQVSQLTDLGLLGFADQFTTHINRTRRWPGMPRA